MTAASCHLVLGIDAGATATRAVVAGTDGRRYGFGRAGGGNPTAHPPEEAAAALAAALRDALVGVDPAEVRSAVVGLAGVLLQPRAVAAFDAAWRGAGLRCRMRVMSDTVVAFAAGTPQPAGTVLVAGTGAIAAAIRDRDIAVTAGGHGWLLGDEGSGFWLGREAVRAALAELDGRPAATALTGLVLGELLGADATATTEPATARDALIAAVNARPPVELARLAPLVTRTAEARDPVARRIVGAAAAHLGHHVAGVHEAAGTKPIVLAGSLLTAGTPVGDSVRRRLRRYFGPVETARDAAAGAAWLAALHLGGADDDAAAALHSQLLSGR